MGKKGMAVWLGRKEWDELQAVLKDISQFSSYSKKLNYCRAAIMGMEYDGSGNRAIERHWKGWTEDHYNHGLLAAMTQMAKPMIMSSDSKKYYSGFFIFTGLRGMADTHSSTNVHVWAIYCLLKCGNGGRFSFHKEDNRMVLKLDSSSITDDGCWTTTPSINHLSHVIPFGCIDDEVDC